MSLYKSPEKKSATFASYDKAMALWPVEYEELMIQTSYGMTHAIVSGPEEGEAVFLLPGLFADATMWYANVGPLSEQYRVYCLDSIAYGGKGEPSEQRVKTLEDYVSWFQQITTSLKVEQGALMGVSYGSWLSLALAREIPQWVTAVVMLDPSESFAKMDGGIAWRGLWAFGLFPSRNKIRKFFDWIGGGYSDADADIWFEHMLDVIEFGSVGMFDIPQHKVYQADDLTMVKNAGPSVSGRQAYSL